MIEGIIGQNGAPLTSEQTAIENTKKSILTIEGLFFAINSATFSLRYHDPMIKGMEFLGKMHERLLAELGPEEVQKMREQYKTQPMPPQGAA